MANDKQHDGSEDEMTTADWRSIAAYVWAANHFLEGPGAPGRLDLLRRASSDVAPVTWIRFGIFIGRSGKS